MHLNVHMEQMNSLKILNLQWKSEQVLKEYIKND